MTRFARFARFLEPYQHDSVVPLLVYRLALTYLTRSLVNRPGCLEGLSTTRQQIWMLSIAFPNRQTPLSTLVRRLPTPQVQVDQYRIGVYRGCYSCQIQLGRDGWHCGEDGI